MDIKITIPTKEMLEVQTSPKTIKRAVGIGLTLLKKYFGSNILLETPQNFQGMSIEFIRTINIFSKFKELGLVSSIKKLSNPSDEPFFHRFYTTSPYKTTVEGGTGANFFDPEKALWGSIAEAVERFIWRTNSSFFLKNSKIASYAELNESALNIFKLAGFSIPNKTTPDILFFTENTKFRWTLAQSLISNKKIYCPTQLLSAFYFSNNVRTLSRPTRKEPMLRWSVTTGIATGRCFEEALTKGILEVIERDAFMITYLNKLSPPILDLENISNQDSDLKKILKSFRRYDLEVFLIKAPSDFPANVILSIIIDHTSIGPAFTMAASADFDLKTCILDSLSECLSIRLASRKHLNKNLFDENNITREGRVQYWAKSENLPKIDFLLRGEKINIDLLKESNTFNKHLFNQDQLKKYYRNKLKILIRELKKHNYEACYIEMTPKKVKALGLRCMNVIIPDLQPLHLNETFPYFYGKRLGEVPKKLGYKSSESINRIPHPFP